MSKENSEPSPSPCNYCHQDGDELDDVLNDLSMLRQNLRKLVEDNRPKGRGVFDMTSTEVELAYLRLCRGIDQLLNRSG